MAKQNKRTSENGALATPVKAQRGTNAWNRSTRLEDVLQANDEEHLYDPIMALSIRMLESPPVIFRWQNVGAFLDAIHTAQAQAATPGSEPLPAAPFRLPSDAMSVQQFKVALLIYLHTDKRSDRLDTSCLPCSTGEYLQLAFTLRDLDFHPWVQRIVAVGGPLVQPIASVYLPSRPRSNMLDKIAPKAPSLWAASVTA